MAYLISCSGKKTTISSQQSQISSLEKMTSFPELYSYRKELIHALGISLDWSKTVPAYELYTGRVYRKIESPNWRKPTTDIIIVSALFGLIRHNELIPTYNVIMTDKIPESEEKIHDFWFKKDLNRFIDPHQDIDLLFLKYKKAFNRQGNDVAFAPPILWRDKYGTHKGEWLNNQL